MADLILVRASVNLAGVKLGEEVLVDPTEAGIVPLIEKGIFVPVEEAVAVESGAELEEPVEDLPAEPDHGEPESDDRFEDAAEATQEPAGEPEAADEGETAPEPADELSDAPDDASDPTASV